MHRALTARWLNRALRIGEASPATALPLFLCPAVSHARSSVHRRIPPVPARQLRANHTDAALHDVSPAAVLCDSAPDTAPVQQLEELVQHDAPKRELPLTCSGCGAFTQTTDPELLGYYDPTSKRVRTWLQPVQRGPSKPDVRREEEDKIVQESLKRLDSSQLKALGLDPESLVPGDSVQDAPRPAAETPKPPVCERCHKLVHFRGSKQAVVPVHHPTVESLRETIEESPHKYNHIYHVIDAADFPMSLVPRLNVLLGDIPLRTKNRRSRTDKFQHDRKLEMSFVITRSDLLAPTKEMVDSLMPYLREVLREALGRVGGRVRLGSVRCVSAKRNWWTQELRNDIWDRGGAAWLVGKANVGKSQLFETIFPKGKVGDSKKTQHKEVSTSALPTDSDLANENDKVEDEEDVELGELLPPAQPATDYPVMPVVSSLPGTTASPIRIPFGKGKGELIDLPGLARGELEDFVAPEHRNSLVMTKRIVPTQISVKEGRSVILGGGLIQIAPRTPGLTFLAYNFTPLVPHLTSNAKALEFRQQIRETRDVENISVPGTGDRMKLAGTFELRHDVTKERAGPLTRKHAVGLPVEKLPFRVLGVDLLIEGVGYVEIVAQVRTRDLEFSSAVKTLPDVPEEPEPPKDAFSDMRARIKTLDDKPAPTAPKAKPARPVLPSAQAEPDWPTFDVFTPEGRFVAVRKPINGWLNNKPLVRPEHKRSRPRKSMKGAKKRAKQEKRAMAAADS